jgi:hypothetical protein
MLHIKPVTRHLIGNALQLGKGFKVICHGQLLLLLLKPENLRRKIFVKLIPRWPAFTEHFIVAINYTQLRPSLIFILSHHYGTDVRPIGSRPPHIHA